MTLALDTVHGQYRLDGMAMQLHHLMARATPLIQLMQRTSAKKPNAVVKYFLPRLVTLAKGLSLTASSTCSM